MAKTESTAVNELIDLVQNQKAAPAEPAADLFAAPRSNRVSPARMTSPVPAGDVAPLPPRRAPHSTSQHAMPPLPVVRMSTADPERGNTIPPLSRSTMPRPSSPPLPFASRPTQPSTPTLRGSVPAPTPQIPRSTQQVRTAPPPQAPVAAPFEVRPSALPVVPQQYPIISRAPTADVTGDVVKADNWFEVSAKVPRSVEETWVGTSPVERQRRQRIAFVAKVTAATIILAAIMVAGYFAFDGDGGKKKQPRTAPARAAALNEAAAPAAEGNVVRMPSPESPKAATAEAGSESMFPAETAAVVRMEAKEEPAPAAVVPAAAPAATAEAVAPAAAVATTDTPAPVREVKTLKGIVTLVDVRIDSKPSGATVMRVDNGKTSFLGTTPLATSLDASRAYDVIFTLEGRPTQMAPLDPSKTSRLDVTLGRSSAAAKKEKRAKKESSKLDASFLDEAAKPAKAEKAVEKKAEPAGEGTLMVSSKPPCEIWIDGKPTGLTTPQRSIPLSAGTHKVTFVNEAAAIKKTVSVSITADQSTKLIQDLMNK